MSLCACGYPAVNEAAADRCASVCPNPGLKSSAREARERLYRMAYQDGWDRAREGEVSQEGDYVGISKGHYIQGYEDGALYTYEKNLAA